MLLMLLMLFMVFHNADHQPNFNTQPVDSCG